MGRGRRIVEVGHQQLLVRSEANLPLSRTEKCLRALERRAFHALGAIHADRVLISREAERAWRVLTG